MAIIKTTFLGVSTWRDAFQKIGWTVRPYPIISFPVNPKPISDRRNDVSELHSYWVIADKKASGARVRNYNAKDIEDHKYIYPMYNHFPHHKTPVSQFKRTWDNKVLRSSEDDLALLRDILKLFVSPTKTKFEDNVYLHDFTCGTSTTGQVALEFHMHYIGNDNDSACIEASADRLAAVDTTTDFAITQEIVDAISQGNYENILYDSPGEAIDELDSIPTSPTL